MRGFSFRLRPGFLCAELVAFGSVFLCPEVFFSVRSKDSVNIGICVSFFVSLCCRMRVLCGGVVCLFFLVFVQLSASCFISGFLALWNMFFIYVCILNSFAFKCIY